MLLSKLVVAIIAAWLISRGAAVNQNWLLTLVGLFIWTRGVFLEKSSTATQLTFVTWFIASLFSLEWLRVLGLDALFALSTVVATFWTLTVYAWKKWVKTESGWLNALSFASIAVMSEYVFSNWPFGGFNWLRISYLLSDAPFVSFSYFVGISVITFIALLFLGSWLQKSFTTKRVFIFLVSGVAIGLLSPLIPTSGTLQNESLKALVVQGGVPRAGLDFNAQRAAVFQNHIDESRRALLSTVRNDQLELIIWPENAADIDPFKNPALSKALTNLSTDSSAPILLGAVLDQGDKLENAAVIATNTELEVVYSKQKLVPFGEFLPFRKLLSPIISRFDRLSRDFVSGEKSQPIMMGGNRIGVLICFEVAFDEIWQKYGGADYLVVLTNNATYAETKQPIQQLRITRLQSIAQGKPVVIASTSGISAYIDERGEIRNLVSENKSTHFLVEIPKSENNAPSLRIQPVLYTFAAMILLYCLIRRRLAVAKQV